MLYVIFCMWQYYKILKRFLQINFKNFGNHTHSVPHALKFVDCVCGSVNAT